MNRKKPTLQDVAKVAQVSAATVSRAMNSPESVSDETLIKIEKAMRSLQYDRARTNGKKTGMIGLVIPNILNPFFPLLVKGIEGVTKVRSYNLILCDSEDNPAVETRNIERLLDINVDGLICVPSSRDNSILKRLSHENFPMVFADRTVDLPGTSFVTVDNQDGAYQAVKYVIDLGHSRILHLAGTKSLSTESERYSGYTRALREAGLEVDESLVVSGGYHFEGAQKAVEDVLREDIPFTAVFASNDQMALGAIKVLREHGRRVPEDISVVGYDDIPYSSLFGLTTVGQPVYQIGRNAIIMLLDMLEERVNESQSIVLRPSMIIRDTCRRR